MAASRPTRRWTALMLAASLWGGQAFAVTPVAPKDDLGKKAQSVAPDKSLAGDITRKKVEKKSEAPTLKYDQFRSQVELLVASKRKEQIETLQKIIKLGAEPKEMPNLLFRLGELYWEESKYYFFESNRKDDEIIAAKDKGDESNLARLESDKAELLARSSQFQNDAVERYKEIVGKYPEFGRIDEVLYFLGHNLWESNKEQDALAIYKTLVTKFPKSRFVPDAWLAFGEFYFNGSQGKRDAIEKALSSYQHAAEREDSSVYGFATYKMGWCNYNIGNFKAARDLFKTVIFHGELAQSVHKENKTALVREARKDYVLAYSHDGDPLAAEDDFKKVGGSENWMSMMKGLAGLYYEDGKDKEAVLTYRRLIQIQPLSPDAPLYQSRIVDAVMRVGKKQITVEQVRALVKITEDVKKAGTIKSDADKKSLAEAEDLAERTMSNLAVNWHNEAKKTRDEQTFGFANEVYADYLSIFPEGKKSYELRFFWAELLNDNLFKFDRAAEQYTAVVKVDAKRIEAKEKPGKYMANAAYNAVLAQDEVAKKFEGTESPPKIDGTKSLPIPEPKKKLLESCETYLKLLPNGDKRVEISYKAAQIFTRYNHIDEAAKRYDDICENHPTHQLAEYSCNLVVDSKNLKNDLDGVYQTSKRYLANEALMKAHPGLQKDLRNILEQTSFKLVGQLESKGRYVAAAKRYLGYVDEFPKGTLADTALFNASVNFYKGHHFQESVSARARLVKDFPTSKFVPDAMLANGEAAESIADFGNAAETYEEYAQRWSKQSGGPKKVAKKGGKPAPAAPPPSSGPAYDEQKAQTALFNAGVFREGLGQFKQALADRQQFLELWPDSKDAAAVSLSMATLQEKQGATAKAVGQYEAYQREFAKEAAKQLDAQARIAASYEKGGNKKLASKTRDELLKSYGKLSADAKKDVTPLSLEQVAQAHYDAQEPFFVEYGRIKLKFPADVFKKALQDKAQRLADLQKRYTETVGFKAGGPAICALTRIGEAYAGFEQGLKGVAMPKGVTQEQEDGIREELEKQAEPLKQKAAEALRTAVAKSRELNLYNACSVRAVAALSETYAPESFPKVIEQLAPVKGLPEVKEGQGLLAAVQPIPEAAEAEEAEPAPGVPPPPGPKSPEAGPSNDSPDSDLAQ